MPVDAGDGPVPMPGELFGMDGEVALVTGASSGLGARAARLLHAAGATVALAARRADRLRQLADELDTASVHPCDVTDDDAVTAAVHETVAAHGRLDVVVSCAGIADEPAAVDLPTDRFAQVLDVNLVGAFRVARAAASHWRDVGQGGRVVHVTSILARVGLGTIPSAAYAASKAGLEGLTRELAMQWADDGVRVNCLAPGFFPSEITTELFGHRRGRDLLVDRTPLGRVGATSDLDGALLLLCSDAARFVTGQVVVVDGGWTAR